MDANVQKIKSRLSKWRNYISSASWKKSAASLLSHLRTLQNSLRKKTCGHPDSFFFSMENLPYFGKEYWFLHFVVPGSDEQVVITAGRSQGQVSVNSKKVAGNKQAAKHNFPIASCAAVCWLYSTHKEVLIDSIGEVGMENTRAGSRIFFRKGKNELSIEGAYPSFSVLLKKGKYEIFSAHATARKKGIKWEMPRILENPITKESGALMVNYFFDFKGRMHKKKIKGKAYLQKVVATIPLAPWNWVRIQFEKNAALDFFTVKPFGDIRPTLHLWSNAFIELKGKRIKLHNLKLSSPASGKNLWVLKNRHMHLSMQPYSLQRFSMRQNTQFHYNEYLVRVKDFSLQLGGRKYTLKELGQASGIVEDAYGYLL